MSTLFQVSVRDHSALIIMTALAAHAEDNAYVRLQDIAETMGLSLGYLEEVASLLKEAGLIAGKQGPKGGYRLTRPPAEITLEDVLTAIEGPIELVDCQKSGVTCPVSGKCSSRHVWDLVQQRMRESLQTTTLENVVQNA